jgi:hypothetical protein
VSTPFELCALAVKNPFSGMGRGDEKNGEDFVRKNSQ